jgi:hypothetical protein
MQSNFPAPAETPVVTLAQIAFATAVELLHRYGLTLVRVADGAPIPGSYWGEPEAGVIGEKVYARGDTPVHSLLHEACHLIVAAPERRSQIHTDASESQAEEDAACYLQILLADALPGVGQTRLMADMDTWGYTFRLGSAQAWFERDAADARAWLTERGLPPAVAKRAERDCATTDKAVFAALRLTTSSLVVLDAQLSLQSAGTLTARISTRGVAVACAEPNDALASNYYCSYTISHIKNMIAAAQLGGTRAFAGDGPAGPRGSLRVVAADHPEDCSAGGCDSVNVESLVKLIAALYRAGVELISEGAISEKAGRGIRFKLR